MLESVFEEVLETRNLACKLSLPAAQKQWFCMAHWLETSQEGLGPSDEDHGSPQA